MTDKIGLILDGKVTLSDFANAVHYLNELVAVLSVEVTGENNIEWSIEELSTGSAKVLATGYAENMTSVDQVVTAYSTVGRSLADQTPIPYSDKVIAKAQAITEAINGQVKAITFTTSTSTAMIDKPPVKKLPQLQKYYTLGTVTGIVDGLSQRRGLKFTLYDSLFDRAVYCYFDDGQKEMIRGIWGEQVRVTGMIYRNPKTGQPEEVYNVQDVTVVTTLDNLKQARGILPWNGEPAEITIRRIRDEF
ncbi:hypothetical protein QUF64_05835 [Anaerolineales bacterium HSG6]|nr:hypothetical protein [Anaerolineales bacterium HSG6]MDM8532956.1 hypothetical protein [Anaerolineales bacterium HSG25]